MAARTVPLGRRNLTEDARRAALSVGGVAVALLLVLILDGIFAGALRQVTAYLRTLPADVVVSQQDVRTMHMSASALPPGTADRAAAVPDVDWVAPIWYASGVVATDTGRQLSYVIGYDAATGRGGPTRLVAGRNPTDGEVVLDELGAQQIGVRLGDRVTVLGTTHTVAGLSTGQTSITNTLAFVTAADFTRLAPRPASYLLVGARPGIDPATLADRLASALPTTTVQTRTEFVDSEARIVTDMSAAIMQIMALLGLLVALAVVVLSLYALTLFKLREYGVVAALGATRWRLARIVTVQAVWTAAGAFAAATGLALLLGALISRITPQVSIAVTAPSVARLAAAALAASLAGALLPIYRLARLDPAVAFRRQP
ncbi:MAG TPA: ABC transporter permease [Propionibacteriaceae bacterium]